LWKRLSCAGKVSSISKAIGTGAERRKKGDGKRKLTQQGGRNGKYIKIIIFFFWHKWGILAEIDIEDTDVDFVSSPDSRYVAFSDGALYLIDLHEFKSSKGTPFFRLLSAFLLSFRS
jgi:hypothetical protein